MRKLLLFLVLFLFLTSLLFLGRRGRFNLLVLGVPGGDHPGPRLSDTIMVLSFSPKDLVVISLPRDIWIEEFGEKINALYPLGGLSLVEKKVSQLLGLKVEKGVALDFAGFKKAVDLLGGLDVEVERSFDDFYYPIPGRENDDCNGDPQFRCRYEHLHFEKGKTHMDGELALKFARSRHATDSAEGTDFARSRRQQKIIFAFKNKLIGQKYFLKPKVLFGLWRIFQSFDSDLGIKDVFSLILHLNLRRTRSFTLDWGRENQGGLLFNPPVEEYGSWVLVPRESWQEIQKSLKEFLED